jgi:Rrf2 family protein
MALRHMAMHPVGQVFTAKEIAAQYDIPYELLAKVLQKLSKAGLILSLQGMRGGYSLAHPPGEMQVSKIIQVIEEEKATITDCYAEGVENCSIFASCSIRRPLEKVQHNLNVLLENTTLEQII